MSGVVSENSSSEVMEDAKLETARLFGTAHMRCLFRDFPTVQFPCDPFQTFPEFWTDQTQDPYLVEVLSMKPKGILTNPDITDWQSPNMANRRANQFCTERDNIGLTVDDFEVELVNKTISPLVLLFFVDQGYYERDGAFTDHSVTTYSLLCMPNGNNRPIHMSLLTPIMDSISEEGRDSDANVSAMKTEPCTVFPYDVTMPEACDKDDFGYNSILMRKSKKKILNKWATLLTEDEIINQYEKLFDCKFPEEIATKYKGKPYHMFLYFLEEVNSFFTTGFDKLVKYESWVELYIYLASRVVDDDNEILFGDEVLTEIHEKLIIPAPCDIVGVCRVLFQSIVTAKVCIPDGQHRVLAMLCALSGFTMKEDSDVVPMRFFERQQLGNLFSTDVGEATTAFGWRTSKLSSGVMIQICLPSDQKVFNKRYFERISQEVSLTRETSSGTKKEYSLVDVFSKALEQTGHYRFSRIKKFHLNVHMKVLLYLNNGDYKLLTTTDYASAAANFHEEPWSKVLPFIVRTSFQNCFKGLPLQLRMMVAKHLVAKAERDQPDYPWPFSEEEFANAKEAAKERQEKAIEDRKKEEKNPEEDESEDKSVEEPTYSFEQPLYNFLDVTSLDQKRQFANFCPRVNKILYGAPEYGETELADNPTLLRKWRTLRNARVISPKDSTTNPLMPERYYVLVMMERLLAVVLADPFNKRTVSDAKTKDYQSYSQHGVPGEKFNQLLIEQVPKLEQDTSRLPLGVKIPKIEKTISLHFGHVSAFLSLAIHDEQSFERAKLFVGREGTSGDKKTIWEPPYTPFKNVCQEVLQPVVESEEHFKLYVIDPLNKMSEWLHNLCLARQPTKSVARIQHLLLRTLASEIVQIYVWFGRDVCCDKEITTRHPALKTLIERHGKTNKCVPLVLDFILRLVLQGDIEVTRTHFIQKATKDAATALNETEYSDDDIVKNDLDFVMMVNPYLKGEFGCFLPKDFFEGMTVSQTPDRVARIELSYVLEEHLCDFDVKTGPVKKGGVCCPPPRCDQIHYIFRVKDFPQLWMTLPELFCLITNGRTALSASSPLLSEWTTEIYNPESLDPLPHTYRKQHTPTPVGDPVGGGGDGQAADSGGEGGQAADSAGARAGRKRKPKAQGGSGSQSATKSKKKPSKKAKGKKQAKKKEAETKVDEAEHTSEEESDSSGEDSDPDDEDSDPDDEGQGAALTFTTSEDQSANANDVTDETNLSAHLDQTARTLFASLEETVLLLNMARLANATEATADEYSKRLYQAKRLSVMCYSLLAAQQELLTQGVCMLFKTTDPATIHFNMQRFRFLQNREAKWEQVNILGNTVGTEFKEKDKHHEAKMRNSMDMFDFNTEAEENLARYVITGMKDLCGPTPRHSDLIRFAEVGRMLPPDVALDANRFEIFECPEGQPAVAAANPNQSTISSASKQALAKKKGQEKSQHGTSPQEDPSTEQDSTTDSDDSQEQKKPAAKKRSEQKKPAAKKGSRQSNATKNNTASPQIQEEAEQEEGDSEAHRQATASQDKPKQSAKRSGRAKGKGASSAKKATTQPQEEESEEEEATKEKGSNQKGGGKRKNSSSTGQKPRKRQKGGKRQESAAPSTPEAPTRRSSRNTTPRKPYNDG